MAEGIVTGTCITTDLEEQQRRILGQVYGMLIDLAREKRATQEAQSGDPAQPVGGDALTVEKG